MDLLIVKLGTTTNPLQYFTNSKLLIPGDFLGDSIFEMSIPERIKLFIRLNYIKNSEPDLLSNDDLFEEYMKNLYYFNSNQVEKLISLYDNVEQAIYQWNGTAKLGGGFINLDLKRQQSTYKVSHKLDLVPAPHNTNERQSGPLVRFVKSINLFFSIKSESEKFGVNVDYDLYQLLRKINKGYRPNKVDKSNHINFTQVVNKLTNYNAQDKDVIIQQFHGERHKKFKLSYNPGFNVFQFEEV